MPVGVRLLQFITLGFTEERANRFAGMGKARIVFIHFYLRNDGDRFLRAARRQAVVQRLLDEVADTALGVCHAVGQRGEGSPSRS